MFFHDEISLNWLWSVLPQSERCQVIPEQARQSVDVKVTKVVRNIHQCAHGTVVREAMLFEPLQDTVLPRLIVRHPIKSSSYIMRLREVAAVCVCVHMAGARGVRAQGRGGGGCACTRPGWRGLDNAKSV